MGNRTTRFLTVSLVLVSVFCVVVFSIQAAWNSAVGAEAITDIGVIYMSGMSEQIATHFGTTIELRLSQVGALADSVPPERSGSGSAAMRVALTHSARSQGFSCLAFCTQEGDFDVIYGPEFTSSMEERVVRVIRAARPMPTVKAGSTRLRNPSSLPPEGNHFRFRAKAMISSRPSQN